MPVIPSLMERTYMLRLNRGPGPMLDLFNGMALEAAMTAKKGPDQLSTDLLNAAVKDQSPDDAVQSRITPDARVDTSSQGWDSAAEKVAKQFS